MRGIYQFLKSTILGGLVVLVPVVVLGAIVVWAVDLALKAITPVFEWLPDKAVGGVSLAALAAVAGLVVACFLAGIAVKMALIRRVGDRAERLAMLVPGYALMKSVGVNLVGMESKYPVR